MPINDAHTHARSPYPPYEGKLRSGDFGPDTGHYHTYLELHGKMARHEQDGRKCFDTRQDARLAAWHRRGHIAIVGELHTADCVKWRKENNIAAVDIRRRLELTRYASGESLYLFEWNPAVERWTWQNVWPNTPEGRRDATQAALLGTHCPKLNR